MSSPAPRPGAAGTATRRRRPWWVWLLLALLAVVVIVVISLLASRCGTDSSTGAAPAPANGAAAPGAAAPGAPAPGAPAGGAPANGAPAPGVAGGAPGAAPGAGAPGTGASGQPAPGNGSGSTAGGAASDLAALQARIDGIVAAAPISFRPNSAELSDSGSQSLRAVARELGTVPTARVAVTGHAAPLGGPGTPDPQQLSEQRATTVADELAAAGVARDRLQTRGVSDTDPGPSPAAARRADVTVS